MDLCHCYSSVIRRSRDSFSSKRHCFAEIPQAVAPTCSSSSVFCKRVLPGGSTRRWLHRSDGVRSVECSCQGIFSSTLFIYQECTLPDNSTCAWLTDHRICGCDCCALFMLTSPLGYYCGGEVRWRQPVEQSNRSR